MREKNIKVLKDQRSLGTLDMADIAFSVKLSPSNLVCLRSG